ncbi:hypothetical protein B0A55_07253 [Friedmanniomyces simplex]|uniref:Calponin-homology (CH) domain-containing protein n=1 Tax=Friedmanniomyces simplex TaxID=329884 RepID=A0A4U0X597_9PEZI|nr:hypothetical protein B0A55_07253 [Friedmanniomyces simplex]
MSRMSLATPCPALTRIPDESRRLSTASWVSEQQDDTCTTDIDYTRAADRLFGHTQPRRPQRRAGKSVAVAIFEDVVEDQELVVDQARGMAGKTLLSKPARKLGRPAMKADVDPTTAQPLGEIGQARKRTSILPQMEEAPKRATTTAANAELKRKARRRTIFVPSEDTTMLTIHPGANTTNRLDDTFQPMDFSLEPSAPGPSPGLSMAFPVETHKPAMQRPPTSLAVAPKRLPLGHLVPKFAGNLPGVDLAGQNGGKENVPPGRGNELVGSAKKPRKSAITVVKQPVQKSPFVGRTKLFEPTAASQARQTVVVRKAVPLARGREMVVQPAATEQKRIVQRRLAPQKPAPLVVESVHGLHRSPTDLNIGCLHTSATAHTMTKPAARRVTPPKSTAKLLQYPVLSEDIAQPQLYEESWLSHQEIALTELINEIFHHAEPSRHRDWQTPARSLREQVLDTYHQPSVTLLHTRLKASLLYGALSRPKDMPSPPDPTHDIGLRRRFLNLWLHSYDEDALRAAAEVVVGRQVPAAESGTANGGLVASESVLDPAKSKRALIGFLETFMVTVEDIDSSDGAHDETGAKAERRWRKTVLRSLMLIWLLDQAKATGVVPGCLFKRTSPHKTSTNVLRALSGLLIPSIGYIMRPLRHFDYSVVYTQDPLDEVAYRIENIATDLRDGIFLTRIVEILLSPAKRAHETAYGGIGEATMTLQLPDTTVIESALYTDDGSPCPRLLSRHLKMPCLGRAQKVYNVQIALSALANHGRRAAVDITADDVVDGHREKTLSLLWTLVSTHGLAQLVDWEELTRDTMRATGDTQPHSIETQEQQEDALKAWATAHSASSGLHISNLTTSFADGKAYKAILDAFADFLPSATSSTADASLESRLRALSCSTAFIKQLTASQSAIPSRTTTVSNLALLASRLLPLARRHNAAVTIQRVFRRQESRKTVTRRVKLARLAYACATVVQTQQRLVHAATVLQRSWRRVLDARISRLNKNVEAFQVVARGWHARREVKRSAARGRVGGQSLGGLA